MRSSGPGGVRGGPGAGSGRGSGGGVRGRGPGGSGGGVRAASPTELHPGAAAGHPVLSEQSLGRVRARARVLGEAQVVVGAKVDAPPHLPGPAEGRGEESAQFGPVDSAAVWRRVTTGNTATHRSLLNIDRAIRIRGQ